MLGISSKLTTNEESCLSQEAFLVNCEKDLTYRLSLGRRQTISLLFFLLLVHSDCDSYDKDCLLLPTKALNGA